MTNIIQWNVRGLRANFEELRLLCNQYNPQIVAVQECQLRKDKIINLTGFSGRTKSSPGDNATGGVTLYVNKSVLFSEIKLDTDLQAVAVGVSAKKTLTVCNVYLPPLLDIHFSDLEYLIQQLPAPFVLVGDFNAHSPLWGDVRQDSRGQMIEELLNDCNLCLLNTGEPTYRHHSHHSFSVPDISICDPSLALEFDWLTHKDLCGSDHFPVILKTSLRADEPAAEHWKFDRADDVISHSLYVAIV